MYDPSSALGSDKFPTLGYCFLKHPMFNQNLQLNELQQENAVKLQQWKNEMNNRHATHTCMFDFNKGVSLLSQLGR